MHTTYFGESTRDEVRSIITLLPGWTTPRRCHPGEGSDSGLHFANPYLYFRRTFQGLLMKLKSLPPKTYRTSSIFSLLAHNPILLFPTSPSYRSSLFNSSSLIQSSHRHPHGRSHSCPSQDPIGTCTAVLTPAPPPVPLRIRSAPARPFSLPLLLLSLSGSDRGHPQCRCPRRCRWSEGAIAGQGALLQVDQAGPVAGWERPAAAARGCLVRSHGRHAVPRREVPGRHPHHRQGINTTVAGTLINCLPHSFGALVYVGIKHSVHFTNISRYSFPQKWVH